MSSAEQPVCAVTSALQTELHRLIADKYEELKHTLGWRMFYSDPSAFVSGTVLLVAFNPGGKAPEPERDGFVVPRLAYRSESWGGRAPGRSQLQQQVLSLLDTLGLQDRDVLAGNLVPFRSSHSDELHNSERSIAFGRSIWSEILRNWIPRLVIALGEDAAIAFSGLLSAKDAQSIYVPGTPSGRYRCTRWTYPGGRLVHLPHLSRCRILREGMDAPEVSALFAADRHS